MFVAVRQINMSRFFCTDFATRLCSLKMDFLVFPQKNKIWCHDSRQWSRFVKLRLRYRVFVFTDSHSRKEEKENKRRTKMRRKEGQPCRHSNHKFWLAGEHRRRPPPPPPPLQLSSFTSSLLHVAMAYGHGKCWRSAAVGWCRSCDAAVSGTTAAVAAAAAPAAAASVAVVVRWRRRSGCEPAIPAVAATGTATARTIWEKVMAAFASSSCARASFSYAPSVVGIADEMWSVELMGAVEMADASSVSRTQWLAEPLSAVQA